MYSITGNGNIFNSQLQAELQSIRKEATANGRTLNFTCGAFDLLHPGHMKMLRDAKEQADFLVVGLQTNPTLDRPDSKNRPIQSLEERQEMLAGIRYIDAVVVYGTEDDLYKILVTLQPESRTLGTDWEGKDYTGKDLSNIKIHWHQRDHSFSSTELRRKIYEAERLKNEKS